jgi:D-Tyr-tRNAtyr deacylase
MKTNDKNLGGQKPFFENAETLQEKINEYFNDGVKKRTVIVGKGEFKEAIELPVPTITGLCYFLGFESRQSFYDYEKREGFSYTIKRARLFIEQEYEEHLQVGNTTGAIFALKNMGWIDKTQTDVTSGGEKIQQPALDKTQIDKLIDKL